MSDNALSQLDAALYDTYGRVLTKDGWTAVYDDRPTNFQVDWYDVRGKFSSSTIYQDDSEFEAAIAAHGGEVSQKL